MAAWTWAGSPPARVADARELLFTELERGNYPIRSIEILSEGEDQVELGAVLVPTTADPNELDAIVTRLEAADEIDSAAWTVSTTN